MIIDLHVNSCWFLLLHSCFLQDRGPYYYLDFIIDLIICLISKVVVFFIKIIITIVTKTEVKITKNIGIPGIDLIADPVKKPIKIAIIEPPIYLIDALSDQIIDRTDELMNANNIEKEAAIVP